MKQIAAKMVEIMNSIHTVSKLGRNAFHNYDYAREKEIVEAARLEMGNCNVIMMTSIEECKSERVTDAKGKIENLVTIRTKHTFIDSDSGESLEVMGCGQGQDSGDKGIYKAQTGAIKYALTKTFLIPTGEDPEKQEPVEHKSKKAATKPGNGEDTVINGVDTMTYANGTKTYYKIYTRNGEFVSFSPEMSEACTKLISFPCHIEWSPTKKGGKEIIQVSEAV